jgi:anti-sigma regulatory factor (Ser/Thr protein kinase)
MCTNGTPASSYLAKWSCAVEADPAPDGAVARTAAWARATMDNWGLGSLADDVGLIVAEFSSNAWTHGSPPVEVTLLLQDGVLTVEVSDAGAGLAVFAGPRSLGAGGRGLPAAVAVAQQIGIDGGAWGTRVWARLHFQWMPAQTGPGTAAA